MKKHKFLSIFAIMFALVFALSTCFFAACGNKEDNDDDTTVTIPDDNEGNDGSEESGDDDDDDGQTPGTTVLDTRIYAADSGDTFTFDEVTYFDATALEITSTAGTDGDVNYTVKGTASLMTEEQADSFWYGVAAKYDAYICYKIQVTYGETISYKTTSDDKSYTNSADADADLFDGEYLHMVARISGDDGNGGTLSAKDVTYKITDGETTTNHNVSFNITIPERDLSHVSVNFGSDDEKNGYGWIQTTQRTVAKSGESNPEYYFDVDPLTEENTEPYTNDILSLATACSGMIVRTDKGALATGGEESSEEYGNYFAIDLTDYENYYVNISVDVSSTESNKDVRSLLLATEVTTEIEEETVLAYISTENEKNEGNVKGRFDLQYSMAITESTPTLYLTWTDSLYIYSIDVEISKTAIYTEAPTKVKISSADETEDGLTLWIPEEYVSSSYGKTATLVATAIDEHNFKYDAYNGAYTWEITDSVPDVAGSDVIKFVTDSTTGEITIQAVSVGTAEVSVTLDSGITTIYVVEVRLVCVTNIEIENYDWINMNVDNSDPLKVIVTMSDGSDYTGKYIWSADETSAIGMDGKNYAVYVVNDDENDPSFYMVDNSSVPDGGVTNTVIWTLTLDDGSTYVLTIEISEPGWTKTQQVNLSSANVER